MPRIGAFYTRTLVGVLAKTAAVLGTAGLAINSLAGERSLSFVGDVLPILSKTGCNSSGCHSKPEGQNGFKLTVFSYDPRSDYEGIVKELRGRRVSPSAPEQSLLLRKPTQSVPHEGGERFAVDSHAYRTIERWIAQGMVYELPDEPVLDRVSIEPSSLRTTRGETGIFKVQAHFKNGTARDVTDLVDVKSNDEGFVTIDEDAGFKIGDRTGEGIVVARYMGRVAIAKLTVPPDKKLPDEAYASVPRNNVVDGHAIERWKELGLFPSDRCSDGEFLRRASLSLIGTLPTSEQARAFLSDRSPDKRRRLVDQLLRHPAWADHWAISWIDLLRPNPDRVGVKSVYVLDQWIRESFRNNKPYDQFARDLLVASGSTHRHGPVVVFRDRRDPENLTTSMSQIFLGVRLECARCHHHPNEKWSQDDFFQFAAFFGKVKRKGTGISPPISGSPEFFYPGDSGTVTHPVTKATMKPLPPEATDFEFPEGGADPRSVLGEWLTDAENPFFARAVVNRVWAAMLGRGFVMPVDDFRASNPVANEPLLDALAGDFVDHGFDLKHLMRRIANSHVFQLSSLPNETNIGDTTQFSRAYRRRLSAEVLTDAVAAVTGVPDKFQGMPRGARAIETWNFKISSDMLDAFGRPDSSEDCPCERNTESSVVQVLHLMHSIPLQAKLSSKEGRVASLVEEKTDAEIIDELYLSAYSRFPTEEERTIALKGFSVPEANRQHVAEDVLWALINSAEFVFNH